jgi:hypothetical protein
VARSGEIATWSTPALTLSFRRPRVFLSLDGEVKRPRTPLRFEIAPKALTVLAPAADRAGQRPRRRKRRGLKRPPGRGRGTIPQRLALGLAHRRFPIFRALGDPDAENAYGSLPRRDCPRDGPGCRAIDGAVRRHGPPDRKRFRLDDIRLVGDAARRESGGLDGSGASTTSGSSTSAALRAPGASGSAGSPMTSGSTSTSGGSAMPSGTASGSAGSTSSGSTMSSTSGAASGNFVTQQQPGQWLASRLIGTTVVSANNESIGDVNDVLMDRNGQSVAVVIGRRRLSRDRRKERRGSVQPARFHLPRRGRRHG